MQMGNHIVFSLVSKFPSTTLTPVANVEVKEFFFSVLRKTGKEDVCCWRESINNKKCYAPTAVNVNEIVIVLKNVLYSGLGSKASVHGISFNAKPVIFDNLIMKTRFFFLSLSFKKYFSLVCVFLFWKQDRIKRTN